ncbi:MAG: hypothetical protein KF716_21320 [Anaerolineae bacterium]|nr:hypothetical protein [Anaerolineae bacterium]
MDSVLSGFILLFVLIFAVFTFSGAVLSAQTTMVEGFQQLNVRSVAQLRTAIKPLNLQVRDSGSTLYLTYRNVGTYTIADFATWDVIVDYRDATALQPYHVEWLAYTTTTPPTQKWTVKGIYQNAAQEQAESVEPKIWNPDEELVLQAHLSAPVGVGEIVHAALAISEGEHVALVGHRNTPPQLIVNAGLELTIGTSRHIAQDQLLTSDSDNTSAQLTYTLVSAPTQGALIRGFAGDNALTAGSTFTQQDIDQGNVLYTHTGSSGDSFTFTVTDGEDTLGPFTFVIAVNAAPSLVTNNGLDVVAGSVTAFAAAQLETIDADQDPSQIAYSINVPPQRGTLNLGTTFTQADINNGALTYTHTGTGSDSFTFSITDGKTSAGPYTFIVRVTEP